MVGRALDGLSLDGNEDGNEEEDFKARSPPRVTGLAGVSFTSPLYTEEEDNLLRGWCEKAICMSKLHTASSLYYRRWNIAFTVPSIILSNLLGIMSFVVEDEAWKDVKGVEYVSGSLNFFNGVLISVSQYLRLAEGSAKHNACAQHWGAYSREIQSILSLPAGRRPPCAEYLSDKRVEYDKLITTYSPDPPDRILKLYAPRFLKYSLIDREPPIEVPEFINGGPPRVAVYGEVSRREAV